MRHLFRRAATALALAVAFTACEGDVPVSTQDPTQITYAPELGVDLTLMTRTTNGVYYRDLVVGEGDAATTGQTIGVRYGGFLNDGSIFDAKSSGTFQFDLGAHQVIAGWDEGIPGMKIGGRRQLVIPPALAYGKEGRDGIPPGAVLIFNVDLITVSE